MKTKKHSKIQKYEQKAKKQKDNNKTEKTK